MTVTPICEVTARSKCADGKDSRHHLGTSTMLGGKGEEAVARQEEIAERRRLREELPPAHLDGQAAVQKLEREAEAKIAEIEYRRDQDHLSSGLDDRGRAQHLAVTILLS
jgi:hypothetical protein